MIIWVSFSYRICDYMTRRFVDLVPFVVLMNKTVKYLQRAKPTCLIWPLILYIQLNRCVCDCGKVFATCIYVCVMCALIGVFEARLKVSWWKSRCVCFEVFDGEVASPASVIVVVASSRKGVFRNTLECRDNDDKIIIN